MNREDFRKKVLTVITYLEEIGFSAGTGLETLESVRKDKELIEKLSKDL